MYLYCTSLLLFFVVLSSFVVGDYIRHDNYGSSTQCDGVSNGYKVQSIEVNHCGQAWPSESFHLECETATLGTHYSYSDPKCQEKPVVTTLDNTTGLGCRQTVAGTSSYYATCVKGDFQLSTPLPVGTSVRYSYQTTDPKGLQCGENLDSMYASALSTVQIIHLNVCTPSIYGSLTSSMANCNSTHFYITTYNQDCTQAIGINTVYPLGCSLDKSKQYMLNILCNNGMDYEKDTTKNGSINGIIGGSIAGMAIVIGLALLFWQRNRTVSSLSTNSDNSSSVQPKNTLPILVSSSFSISTTRKSTRKNNLSEQLLPQNANN